MSRRSSCRAGLAALALMLAAPPAPAQGARVVVPAADAQWVLVNETDGGRGYVDQRSIRSDNGKVRYMGRIVYGAATEDGTSVLLHRGEIDCAGNTFQILAFDALGADGRLINSFTNAGELPAEPINADSPNAALHRDHC
jgi:hypothetical protein